MDGKSTLQQSSETWPSSDARDSAGCSSCCFSFISQAWPISFREGTVEKDKRMCEGKFAQKRIMALKGMKFSSLETSAICLWRGPEESQSHAEFFSGGDQASVENRLQYLRDDMCQVSLLTCLNS